MVFQAIIELATGKAIGAEALARFPGQPYRPPNEWFGDAAEVGLGVELELSAIRVALSELDRLPSGTYLSLNAGPATVISPALHEMLRCGVGRRVVLELTEHVGIEDYRTDRNPGRPSRLGRSVCG
jgi:EAL domain-containing protein (putative c-di-GMP-specific phosphodiesterase class I)